MKKGQKEPQRSEDRQPPGCPAGVSGSESNKWHSLIDKVWSEKTLEIAWEKVSSNAGACGVDNITIDYFAKDSQTRLPALKEQLTKQTYQPQAIKRVWIPKPGSSEERPLGIPTVKDRVVQWRPLAGADIDCRQAAPQG